MPSNDRTDADPRPAPDRMTRRSFLGGAAGSALLLGTPLPLRARDTGGGPASYRLMQFDVSYRTVIADLPGDAEDVRLWMPLPSSDYAQDIDRLEIQCPHEWSIRRDPVFGSRMIFVDAPPETFELAARYRVTRRQAGVERVALAKEDLRRYLQLTKIVRVTPEVDDFARHVIGSATEPMEIARRVFDGIGEALVYDKKIPGCGTGDTAWVMKHRRGKCDDYHALFMAILISRDIPLRWEQGFPLPLPTGEQMQSGTLEGDCTGAHCWVSFYDKGNGWVPVDASEGDKLEDGGGFYFGHIGPNRFKVSEGRAVRLDPPQGGDVLPNFAYAYAESDRIPLIYGANYENLINYTIRRVERA